MIDDVVRACEAMSKGNGYHYDYDGVVLGEYLWEAEDSHETPTVQVFVVPILEGSAHGGERTSTMFRLEDQVHVKVHIKSKSGDAVRPALRVRADLEKALFVDRNRGVGAGGAGRPQTLLEGVEFLYYSADGKETLGASVDAMFRIRWDHASGDQTNS
jgi:hypothetical protein